MELVLELPCHRCGKKIDGFEFIISYLYLVNFKCPKHDNPYYF